VSSCSTYEDNSIGSIDDLDIPIPQKSLFILNSYLDSSVFLRKVRRLYFRIRGKLSVDLPAWPSGNSRVGPIALLPTIDRLEAELLDLKPGEFHFAHLMLPHYPYVLASDCSVRPRVRTWLNRAPFEVEDRFGVQNSDESRAERYIRYFEQLRCTRHIVDRLFAAIEASGHWDRAIVLVHGDHGSRISRKWLMEENLPTLHEDDYRDASSAFFAVRNETSVGRFLSEPRSLQALLSSAWSIPVEKTGSNSHHVYLETRGGRDYRPTSLRGFAPIEGLPKNGKPQER
jgi:hypothetical protein